MSNQPITNDAASLRSSVVDCIRQTLAVDDEEMDPDAQFGLTPGWDSVGHMNLMVALENRFDIVLPLEDLPLLTSVTAIVDYLEKHGTTPRLTDAPRGDER